MKEGRVLLREQMRGAGVALFLLAINSLLGGLLEAAILVLVTRIAVGLTSDSDSIALIGSITVTGTQAAILALVLISVRMLLGTTAAWQSAQMTTSRTAAMQQALAEAFLQASWSIQHADRLGRLQELLTTFAQQGSSLMTAAVNFIASSFSLAALVATAIFVEPGASVAMVVGFGLLSLLLRPVRSAVRRRATDASSSGLEFATSLAELSQLGMEMHVFGVRTAITHRVSALIGDVRAINRRLRFMQNLVPVIYAAIGYAALVAALVSITIIGSSNLASFGAVVLIMLRSLSYGQGVQMSAASIQSSLPFVAAFERELTRYRGSRAVNGSKKITRIGRIRLENVSFAYPNGSPALKGIDITLGPQEVVGIVGPSGSGKSTLVQLLLGLRPPTSGRIVADGHDLASLSASDLSRRVTFVPQHPRLFAGSVADNIRFFRENVTQQDIETAAQLANLHDDVVRWSDGYDRQVGSLGSNLSGGQQQRLVLARALVERPDVLILDEATSAVDLRSEALILRALNTLRSRMTIVIIAHRLSMLNICDRVMVVQDGRVTAFDEPARLSEHSTFYREALILSGGKPEVTH